MKNKKIPLIALVVSFLLGIFGGTIAYYSGSASYTNEFQAAKFRTKTTENFTAPTNWRAGEEIPNSVVTTNEGTIPVAVRLSYTERWEDSNGDPLNIPDAVTINLDNQNRWEKVGNYYYYKSQLNPGFSTKSLIKSVTLNNSVGDVTCTTSANHLEQVCETTGAAAGKKYILLINIETVDIELYQDVWNTDLVIGEYDNPIQFINRQNENSVTVGDLVKLGDTEEFYVVSSDEDDTVLLAHYNLNVGARKNPDVTEGLQHSSVLGDNTYGNVYFTTTDYWKNKIGAGLDYEGNLNGPDYPYVYDSNSYLYSFVEDYKSYLQGLDISIKEARVLSTDEITELGCNIPNYSCLSAPSWLYDTSFWLGNIKASGADTHNFYIKSDGYIYGEYTYSPNLNNPVTAAGLRPVVVVSTQDVIE